jgi:NADH-quinone oxidoreductase subunit L
MLFRLQLAAGTAIFQGFAGDTIAWIGALTALLAALMATQQDDIKRILAYSTLSQLGYMILAVGLAGHASPGSENLGGQAGLFHLYTHAWFKALLFLAAGAAILACHHQQDIWKMGGLAGRMPLTSLSFATATAALVAVPFTSGFFSKEQILELAHDNHTSLFWIAAAVALLTPFYMTRLFVVAFLGSPRSDPARSARETSPVMLLPLLALAAMALLAGFPALASRLSPAYHHPEALFHLNFVTGVSLTALALGAGSAWSLYRGRDTDPLASSVLATPLRRKFYFDELYAALVRYAQDFLAGLAHFFDEFLINGLLVGGLARATAAFGQFFRRLQTGNLQAYAILFGAGLLLVVYLTVFVR